VAGQQPVFDAPAGQVKEMLPNPWVGDSPLVFLVKEDLGDWLEVYLPVRPNGSTGFVPTSDVEVTRHDFRMEVNLSEFNLKVFQGDEVFLDTVIAVAADNTPTPGGLYYTTELLQPTDDAGRVDPEGLYGHFAYGLSGYSEVLESFNGGPGQLGIHGTNQPELMGQQVSNGCIRVRNEDIDRLAPVLPLGVPVEVIS
jgi:lipoprotein-anchoring transpeptidase ErfK/SrfK